MLHDEAFKMIEARDKTEGQSWSDDTGAIADMIVEFHKNKCKEMYEIIEKYTQNRKGYKNWELQIIAMLEEK